MEQRGLNRIWKLFTNFPEKGVAICNLCRQPIKNSRTSNLIRHVRRIHGEKREAYDKYYKFDISQNIAECKICGRKLKNCVGNVRKHMQRCHEKDIKLQEHKLSMHQSSDEDSVIGVFEVTERQNVDQNNSFVKRQKGRLHVKTNKMAVISSVIGLTVEDGISPNFFRSKHMTAILAPMSQAISEKHKKEFKINESEVEKILSSLANYIRNDFSNDLQCRLLSIRITTDLTASYNTFCVSAQFICNGEIQNRVLGIIDLHEEQQLKPDYVMQLLHKYSIDSNQIVSVSWDKTKSQYDKRIQNSDYFNEVEQLMQCPELFLGDIKIAPYLSSIAQLCLMDILKHSNIFQSFLECRNIVKYISDESNGFYQLFDLTNFLAVPQLDSPWKAGSTYEMMNALNEAKLFLETVKFNKIKKPEDRFTCNENMWSFVDAFCKSTNYLQKSILKFSSEELHIGDFYAQWLKCKILTEKLFANTKKTQNSLLSTMLNIILKNIENRTEQLLSHDHLVACLYLDPRFQGVLNEDQISRAVTFLKRLWCRAKLYIVDDSETTEKEAAALLEDDDDAYLNEFLCNGLDIRDKKNNDVFKKIEELKLSFQSVITNILSYWECHKVTNAELQALSSICFAIPATEKFNKELYSHVYRLDANSELSKFTRENLLNIRLNSHLLDEALAKLKLGSDEEVVYTPTLNESEMECYEISDDESNRTDSTFSAHSVAGGTPSSVSIFNNNIG